MGLVDGLGRLAMDVGKACSAHCLAACRGEALHGGSLLILYLVLFCTAAVLLVWARKSFVRDVAVEKFGTKTPRRRRFALRRPQRLLLRFKPSRALVTIRGRKLSTGSSGARLKLARPLGRQSTPLPLDAKGIAGAALAVLASSGDPGPSLGALSEVIDDVLLDQWRAIAGNADKSLDRAWYEAFSTAGLGG